MCRFFDQKAYNQCREPSAERIIDKEKANFCDYFSLGDSVGAEISEKDKFLSAAEALFKK